MKIWITKSWRSLPTQRNLCLQLSCRYYFSSIARPNIIFKWTSCWSSVKSWGTHFSTFFINLCIWVTSIFAPNDSGQRFTTALDSPLSNGDHDQPYIWDLDQKKWIFGTKLCSKAGSIPPVALLTLNMASAQWQSLDSWSIIRHNSHLFIFASISLKKSNQKIQPTRWNTEL